MTFSEGWSHSPYLKSQLLSYLGNKRRLLPFIYASIKETQLPPEKTTFVDLFTGSGAVGRLAKTMGFSSIIANDWEVYSAVTQRFYLGESAESFRELFQDKGGAQAVLAKLNHLEELSEPSDAYISRYYAPKNLEEFNAKRERLFYTPQNAIKIDAIRSMIEKWYPESQELSQMQRREKDALIALLLYECSVHTNTGGVFKAYYKEFGGYGHHALKRILSPIHLHYPVLEEAQPKIQIWRKDANILARELVYDTPFSLVYLDPPYNIHQYGSNYHLLNTIALWDKPDLQGSYAQDGNLKKKAGIREDWQNTRSSYCSSLSAKESFAHLIESIPADIIMVSYSTDGLITFEDMVEILSSRGKIHVSFNPYVKYRGGKKSLTRVNHNVEFILWVDTRKAATTLNKKRVFSSLHDVRRQMDISGVYDLRGEFRKNFTADKQKKGKFYWKGNKELILSFKPWGELSDCQGLEALEKESEEEVYQLLSQYRAQNKLEELEVFLHALPQFSSYQEALPLFQKIYKALQFLAHPKNREDFLGLFARSEKAIRRFLLPEGHPFFVKWQNLWTLFQKRDQHVER